MSEIIQVQKLLNLRISELVLQQQLRPSCVTEHSLIDILLLQYNDLSNNHILEFIDPILIKISATKRLYCTYDSSWKKTKKSKLLNDSGYQLLFLLLLHISSVNSLFKKNTTLKIINGGLVILDKHREHFKNVNIEELKNIAYDLFNQRLINE